MKIQKFLDNIEKNMVHNPSVDITTLKLFIQSFQSCLSGKELKRWATSLRIINNYSTQQITLKEIVNKEKTKNLSKQLKQIKSK